MSNLKLIKKSIGFKISIPIILTTSVIIIAILLINNYLFIKYGENEINKVFQNKMQEIEKNLKQVEDKALWISSAFSELTIVKEAYKKYYATDSLQQSSQLLEKEFVAINAAILKNTGSDAKIHFHIPPATSFLRCWSSKRGDNLASFRPTVLKISESHLPVSGIEIGRGGFEIRGIAPIFDEKKQYLGSVETLFPIEVIFENAKSAENEDFAIFMHSDMLSIASDFLKKNESNVNSKNKTIGKLILIKSTSDRFKDENLPETELNTALVKTTNFTVEDYEYLAFPIYNFEKKAQAVGVIQLNKNDLISSINRITT